MSHFAKVIDGVVTEVIVATQEEINSERHGDAFNWVQTSYNDNFRGNFAEVDGTYTSGKFISKKPFDSWVLDDNNTWTSPVAMPTGEESYMWNEVDTLWEIHPDS